MIDKTQHTQRIEDEIVASRHVRSLKTGVLDKFFENGEKNLWDAFNNASCGDTKTLTDIHHRMRALKSLEAEVQSVINTGKLAQVEKAAIIDN